MPQHQGGYDGLCGPYAIANALEQCGLADSDFLFRLACLSASPRRWPDLLWNGTTFGDLRRMIRLCLDSPANDNGVRVRYPFHRDPPANNRDYWRRFDEAFEGCGAICGIIGIQEPHEHWIVVSRHREQLLFTDSAAGQAHQLKGRDGLYAGTRRRRSDQWLIASGELVLFYR